MDRLHYIVGMKLRGDLAVVRLVEQASIGDASERTQRRAVDTIADAAEDDPVFAGELERLVKSLADREVATGRTPPAAVRNMIGGGSQQGVVIMGGSISHLTVQSPAPQQPRNETEDQQRKARDDTFQRFLAHLPNYRPDNVQWKRIRRNVYKPASEAYAVADVAYVLNEIRKLIAVQDLSGLGGYLSSVSLNAVQETGQPDIAVCSASAVRSYLFSLRMKLSSCLTKPAEPRAREQRAAPRRGLHPDTLNPDALYGDLRLHLDNEGY